MQTVTMPQRKIRLYYLNTATNDYEHTDVDFTADAFKALALDSGTTTFVGAELKQTPTAPFDAVPEIVGGDSDTLVLRLVSAMAPSRLTYEPSSSESGNPKLNTSVSVSEAFSSGITHPSSGFYFSLAATSDPPTFEALRELLSEFINAENFSSVKKSAAILGISKQLAPTMITSRYSSKLLSSVIASACTTPLAYVRSSESESRWTAAVVLRLQQTLLPLVSGDRFKLLDSTLSSPTSAIDGRKNSKLVEYLETKTSTDFSEGSIVKYVHHMYTKLKEIDRRAAITFFERDEAPEYCFPSDSTPKNYDNFSTDASEFNPPIFERVVSNSSYEFVEASVSNIKAISTSWKATFTIEKSASSNTHVQSNNTNIVSADPYTNQNGDTFTVRVNGTQLFIERTPGSDTSSRSVGWSDNIEKVPCTLEKTAIMIEASLFLKAHETLVALYSNFYKDVVVNKM